MTKGDVGTHPAGFDIDGLIADKARLDHIVARTFDKKNGSHDPNPGRSRVPPSIIAITDESRTEAHFFEGSKEPTEHSIR